MVYISTCLGIYLYMQNFAKINEAKFRENVKLENISLKFCENHDF